MPDKSLSEVIVRSLLTGALIGLAFHVAAGPVRPPARRPRPDGEPPAGVAWVRPGEDPYDVTVTVDEFEPVDCSDVLEAHGIEVGDVAHP